MHIGVGDLGQWVGWGRVALLPGHRDRMEQAAVEMMLLPRLSPSPGHLFPWVKQSPGRAGEGPIVRVRAGWRRGTHGRPRAALPAAARVFPGRQGPGRPAGDKQLLCPGSCQQGAFSSPPQPPATSAGYTRGAPGAGRNPAAAPCTDPPIRAGRETEGEREKREIFNGTVILTESISSSSCCFFVI